MPSYVVVGASKGLGYQFLETASQQDPTNVVIGLVRSPEDVQKKVEADGLKNVHIIHGDLDSNISLIAAAKKTAGLTGGALDYLIVNGVYASLQTHLKILDEFIGVEDVFLEDMRQSMQTNVGGTMFSFNAFVPLLLKSNIKRVAAISSVAALRDFIYDGEDTFGIHYAISKAAMNTLVAKFAARYKHEGIKFVSISPGLVNTHPEAPKEFIDQAHAPSYRYDPGLKRPLSPVQSVEMCLQVLHELKQEQSGEFLSHHGSKTLWLEGR